MTDRRFARLLGKCNGYEIAYRLAELRQTLLDPNAIRTEVEQIITQILQASADEYPEEHKAITKDQDLLTQYTEGLFVSVGIRYHEQSEAAAQ